MHPDEFCSTVELKVNYFYPLDVGDNLVCRARVVFRGTLYSSNHLDALDRLFGWPALQAIILRSHAVIHRGDETLPPLLYHLVGELEEGKGVHPQLRARVHQFLQGGHFSRGRYMSLETAEEFVRDGLPGERLRPWVEVPETHKGRVALIPEERRRGFVRYLGRCVVKRFRSFGAFCDHLGLHRMIGTRWRDGEFIQPEYQGLVERALG